MPSSVREGVRPRAASMRSYSSAVMLCWASNCGVMVVGSGTTAEDAVVITVAFIVAWRVRWNGDPRPGRMEENLQRTNERAICGEWIFFGGLRGWKWYGGGGEWSKGCAILLRADPTQAGMAELADAADSKSAGPCGHG